MILEITDRDQYLIELALRIVLDGLLSNDKVMIEDVSAISSLMSNGSFGDHKFKPVDPNYWIDIIKPMKELLDKINPQFSIATDTESVKQ